MLSVDVCAVTFALNAVSPFGSLRCLLSGDAVSIERSRNGLERQICSSGLEPALTGTDHFNLDSVDLSSELWIWAFSAGFLSQRPQFVRAAELFEGTPDCEELFGPAELLIPTISNWARSRCSDWNRLGLAVFGQTKE
jgi:hypothetical protein